MGLPNVFTIVSGGQTGADRAALDFAIRFGIPHDGWCPRGRLAEDGPLEECYQLQETPVAKYDQRTRWNVRDSDATLVVSIQSQPTGGTALTLGVARLQGKPCLHIARDEISNVSDAGALVAEFLLEHHVTRLNVAGPRASQEPAIAAFVNELLTAALASQVFTRAES
jgi:hypothetical protein